MFNFETWALHRQQIGCTLKSVFWTDSSCFHRWNLGFQKRHIEIRVFGGQPTLEVWFLWTTEYFQLRSLGLWRKQILRTFNRGLGWNGFSTLVFGFGETNISNSEIWVLARWNVASFEIWVWRDSLWKCGCGAGNKYFQFVHLCFEDSNKPFRPLHPLGPQGRPSQAISMIWNCVSYHFYDSRFFKNILMLSQGVRLLPACPPPWWITPSRRQNPPPPWQPFLKHLPP